MQGLWVELVFMMVILKIPVVYLCAVVYWAIRAEPRPTEGAAVTAGLPVPEPPVDSSPAPCPWHRGRPRRPRGGSGRRPVARPTRVGA